MTDYFMTGIIFLLTAGILWGQNQLVPPPTTKSYLALRDSYTIGESVTDSMRWPNQLFRILNSLKLQFKVHKIVAKTGWTTDELLAGRDLSKAVMTYDYVSSMIGVNNQYRGRSIENFRIEFIQLVEQRKIAFFDITPISRQTVTNPALVAAHGLHPSGKIYTQWVELISSFFNSVPDGK